jgi:hypothetical protein
LRYQLQKEWGDALPQYLRRMWKEQIQKEGTGSHLGKGWI